MKKRFMLQELLVKSRTMHEPEETPMSATDAAFLALPLAVEIDFPVPWLAVLLVLGLGVFAVLGLGIYLLSRSKRRED